MGWILTTSDLTFKKCTGCGETKSVDHYYRKNRGNGKYGLMAKCKSCHDQITRAHKKENPHIQRGVNRRYRETKKGRDAVHEGRRSLRGIVDVKEMPTESLLEACGGICDMPGCGRAATDRDHDHDTGLTRGMLCNRCNIQLARAGDGRDLSKLTEAQLEYVTNPPVYRKG